MAVRAATVSVLDLARSCEWRARSRWRYGIGLCVSGGPDSMALAALFSQIIKSQLAFPGGRLSSSPPGTVRAFIVDHQAREGSREEAEIVARRLESLGLPSEILRIQWPAGTVPMQLKDFETRARTERYRLLARAAIRHKIPFLYLGHHKDDQVENFLMRLTQSEHGIDNLPKSALVGMKKVTTIPCCNDIFGAVDSESVSYPTDATMRLAHNGLKIIRPFLAYPKAALIATCENMGVPFFTDETNLDPTRTRRNAVRHLMTNYRLPRALERGRLFELQDKIRLQLWKSEGDTHDLWRRLIIRRFDIRSCLLCVEFPLELDLGLENSFSSVAHVLSVLLDAVSPLPRGSLPLSAGIVEQVVETLTQGTNEASRTRYSAITTAGVLIKPGLRTLQVCREPLRRSARAKLTCAFAAPSEPQLGSTHSWTEWMFWDNRYWLRLKLKPSEDPRDYTVRAFTEADVAHVKARLQKVSSAALQTFQDTLEAAAPGKIRFTLPVIVKSGHVAAFPTLNIALPDIFGQTGEHPSSPGMPWQVRLKHQTRIFRRACIRCNVNPTPSPGNTSASGKNTFADAW